MESPCGAGPASIAEKQKRHREGGVFVFGGVPTGIRTPVIAVKGRCPRPLDDGDKRNRKLEGFRFVNWIPAYAGMTNPLAAGITHPLVEVVGIEPATSCMPCKRSPS